MIKLYHGSNIAIDRIDLSIGRKGKDFGQGFYLSPDLKQAQRMAQIAVEREGFGSPTVTTFLFDDAHLTDGSVASNVSMLIPPIGHGSLSLIVRTARPRLSMISISSLVRLPMIG